MKARNLLLTVAVGALAMGCNSGSLTQTSAPLKTAADTASYYLGYLYGTGMQRMGLEEPNMNAIVAGFNSALQEKETEVAPQAMEMYLNRYFQNLAMKRAMENAEKGKKFLEDNLKKAGVDTLSDGIQYKVIKEGNGPKPATTDKVKVHYRGTLIDGTEFDSSIKRGEPAEFQLNRVIPGWTKALQQMPVGSKWEIYIPADQAYGSRGAGPIGPNETLIFEVELLDIIAPEAPKDKK
ncbi:MAG TPA: FKBP-type peptidyl-prolyl cis-trans isomerase [Candidatus Odoribacter faecigallinarum]|uniref:Peptidyl-prolyl cis-trans isomerase n=1 Tax=Candidatus Odoribacter faecigallinarum TaxID=2838706 RepID=A0A9D1UZF9_9BACT|nr:FKBP-type peptidyl-prolyl cis-trans isomerase [Candidatus Odoribacter faecigallinarum]